MSINEPFVAELAAEGSEEAAADGGPTLPAHKPTRGAGAGPIQLEIDSILIQY